MPTNKNMLPVGMVGAGKISIAHRIALSMDNLFRLEAGVFSRGAERSQQLAIELGVERSYVSYEEMAKNEAYRRENKLEAIQFVVVVTHDQLHYQICKCFLEYGFHVVCDKPLTHDLEQALELQELAKRNNCVLALTHNYSAYAMVREARSRVLCGELGEIHLVMAEHAAGSLYWKAPEELLDKWRYRADDSNYYGMIFDIGTHAHHLLRFITGVEIESLSAQVQNLSLRTKIYDNALIQARLTNHAAANIWVSRVATGHAHGLRIRVYGDKGSLEWQQEDPCQLYLRDSKGTLKRLSQGSMLLAPDVQALSRISIGHPEGFFSSFANLYCELYLHLCGQNENPLFPQATDGVAAVRFVYAVRSSAESRGAWQTLANT